MTDKALARANEIADRLEEVEAGLGVVKRASTHAAEVSGLPTVGGVAAIKLNSQQIKAVYFAVRAGLEQERADLEAELEAL